MTIRHNLIRDLIMSIDSAGAKKVGHCPDKVKIWLEGLPLPLDLKRTLQWNWINADGPMGPYRMASLSEVMDDEWTNLHLQYRMFPIGTSDSGDALVIRFSEDDCEVGMTEHANIASEEGTPAEWYARVCLSVDEFLFRAIEGRYLPQDYWAAADYEQMRIEMGDWQKQNDPKQK